MEPEREPSSPTQKPLWPLALLGIVVAASFVKSTFMKSRKTLKPSNPKYSSPDANREADEYSSQSPDQITLASTQPKPEPTPRQCEVTCKTKRDWIDWATLGFEFFGLAVLVAYTIFTALMYCANRDAANAATSAATTAHDALIASERPWLTVDITLKEPPHAYSPGPGFFFNSDGSASLNAFIVVKNIGHSPATSIYIRPQMYPPKFENLLTEPSEKQKAWCEKARGEKPDLRMLPSLMPGEEDTENFTFGMSKADVQAAMQSPAAANMQAVIPVIYGCVNYHSNLFEGVRQTPFMYQLTPVRTFNKITTPPKLVVFKLFRGKAPD